MAVLELSLKEKIYTGASSEVFRAEQNGRPVVVKRNLYEYPDERDLASLRHEYEIGKKLVSPYIVSFYGLEKMGNRLAVIMEDAGGNSLDKTPGAGLALPEILDVMLQTAHALAELHRNNVIHKDLKPANILYHPSTKSIKLIDFSISSELSSENQTLVNPDRLEGTLAYISPEQTGRMNRPIDYRTDFYSLGVTFYQLLTGRVPFASEDPMELTHSHLARTPAPPHEVNPILSPTLSAIVAKLMAKNAEDRYQSAAGLIKDIKRCIEELEETGKISDFQPGLNDFSDKFTIPQKLYGRENEIDVLLKTFEKAAAGDVELLLVSGYSGVGKSALVSEVHKPIVRRRGYFIAGKFDQFKRNVPYSALIQAFRDLVLQILSESQSEIDAWKKKLQEALGSNGQIITDVITEMELIIGKQAPVPPLPITEAQNRFNLVFLKFIQSFARDGRPLVIFLDDLQWADGATLALLERLALDVDSRYLFLIGAYRNNEVDAAHPLQLILTEIRSNGKQTPEIILTPLTLNTVGQIIGDTFHQTTDEVKPLADVIFSKTLGNPFFVGQFLRALYEEKAVVFNAGEGRWIWSVAAAQALSISDNVVELMTRKLVKLPEATQRILQLASCVGAEFDLLTLATIFEQPPFVSAAALKEAVQEELLIAKGDFNRLVLMEEIGPEHNIRFKFLHDRVQQAAYTMIPEETRKFLHLTIGRLLLEAMPQVKWEENIFDLVNQLNQGAEYMQERKEIEQLIMLNFKAAEKARASTAYQPARDYLETAMNLLPPNPWQSNYKQTFALYQARSECEYLCKNFQEAERLFDVVLLNAQTKQEKARILLTKITLYTNLAKFSQALEIGLQALKLFGVNVPRKPSKLPVLAGVVQARLAQGGRSVESLLNAPPMSNPDKLLVLLILAELVPSSYVESQNLFALVVLKMVTISLKYGNVPASSFSYLSYGAILGSSLGDFHKGYAFGELALKLSEKFNDPIQICRANFAFGFFINPWTRDIRDGYPYIKKAFPLGLESGDLVYAIYSAQFLMLQLYMRGEKLPEVKSQCLVSLEFLRKAGDEGAIIHVALVLQVARALAGETDGRTTLNSPQYDEEKVLQTLHEKNLPLMIVHRFHFARATLRFYYGQFEEALTHQAEAAKHLETLFSTFGFAEHYFMSGMFFAGAYDSASSDKKGKYKAQLAAHLRPIRKWAKFSPANFTSRCALLEAETARIAGNFSQAEHFYEKAINDAKEREYLQIEALACERYAKALNAAAKNEKANQYIRQAHFAYRNWGALAKTAHLEEQYPFLERTAESAGPQDSRISATITASRSSQSLDLATVMKATQTISGEIKLDRLLDKMMRIVIENAGAERGFLIFDTDGRLTIEAEGELGKENVSVLGAIPIESSESIPISVVNYVYRTNEIIIEVNAAEQGRFTQDAYISNKQIKSALCMPVMHQGALVAILYLENNLVAGAFTKERIEVLQILSAQIAISIDNARLYENLEQKVAERTAEVRRQKEELEQKNEDITESITYARRIQFAILPPLEIIKRNFPNSFVYYQPRDIVSGDFYWFSECDGCLLMSAVDCTGHGVPGAFMSVMGNGFLNQIVREYQYSNPAQILNELHVKVVQNLSSDDKAATKIHDGMDLALCSINPKTRKLIYSSANRPVYWFGKDGFREIKGEKLPIGGSNVIEAKERFTAQYFDLSSGDTVYLFSDGITDQFGGEKGRKLTSKKFQSLVESIQGRPMEEQAEIIHQEIMVKWKGNLHQTDDVLVIGVKIE